MFIITDGCVASKSMIVLRQHVCMNDVRYHYAMTVITVQLPCESNLFSFSHGSCTAVCMRFLLYACYSLCGCNGTCVLECLCILPEHSCILYIIY